MIIHTCRAALGQWKQEGQVFEASLCSLGSLGYKKTLRGARTLVTPHPVLLVPLVHPHHFLD